MFLKKYKQLIIGIVIGSVVAGTGATYAAINASTVNYKFKFDGVQKSPTGYSVIDYNDHTYVPARFVGENLGATVGWDDSTKTVTFQSPIQLAFTNEDQHPETVLEGVINSAKSTLDISIYSITHPDIVDAIVIAKKRGVQVRIITDKTEAGNQYQKAALNELLGVGIPIKENTHSGLMHLKVTIADKADVTTGSYNYSKSASTTNDEVLVKISNSSIANQFETEFNSMWNASSGFKDYTAN